ncbi:TonB-dependent receptor [Maricaulis sp.]|uniref:TonB-dependent receptor n=1 Tax=Maricaulis sp. TaxID=1486257 RepID=UPI00262D23F9|nr:TonB-dependent receptor [Maricaulis sp.]MDF1768676.1 TonB-dependent receptor [Maricaulis sp.]
MTKSKKADRWRSTRYALLGTTAMVATLAAQPAMAQEAETANEESETSQEVITIQGVRGALLTARNTKREADTFVDSITASDVSQLPDLSVAEALARVPGVVVQRFVLGGSDGDFPSPEGSGNIVRGLQYVRSEFNGRDAFSANGGRALEWASIPPELIGSVDVFKNQTADMLEGGIAGTVNLRTLEPFDRDGQIAILAADGTYADLAEEWSPGYSAIFGDRWSNNSGDFGILASFSTSELQSRINGFQYGQLMAIPNPDNAGTTMALPGGWQARDAEIGRERDSYYLAGQWRSPNGDIELTLKATRVENFVQTDERTLEFFTDAESWNVWSVLGDSSTRNITPFTSAGIPRCNGNGEAANGGVGICESLIGVDGGLMESGMVSNNLRDWLGQTGNLQTPLQSLAIAQTNESMTQDFSANLQWRVNERLYVELDAQYTEAEATMTRLWAGGNHFADYRFDFSDAENPEIELFLSDQVRLADWGGTFRGADPGVLGDLGDPRYAFLLYAADQFEDNTGDLTAFRADAEYEFGDDGWFDSVQFGARFSEREQINRSAGLNWAGIAPPWNGGYLPYANRVDADAYDVADFSGFMDGNVFQGDITSIVFPSRVQMQDYEAFVASLAAEPLMGGGINGDGNLQVGDWVPLRQNGVVDYVNRGIDGSVKEQTTNFYGRMNFGQEFSNGQSVTGNFGLRYVRTDTTGGGFVGYAEFAEDDPLDATQPRDFLPETAAYLDQANQANTIDNSYEYWLPSFNVRWDLNDEMIVRFAASQAISPANIANLNSNRGVSAELGFVVDSTATPPAIADIVLGGINEVGGNPTLDPVEATNFDLSYEWYFGSDGLFTASAFYKDLSNIIVYGEETIDSVTLDGYTVPVTYSGNLNLNDGTVEGVEFSYQQFFTDWPGLFGNLGVQANMTFLTSETSPLPSVQDADGDGVEGFLTVYRWGVDELLGLSDKSYNLIGIYQDDQFEVRLAYNWRSAYWSSYRDFITGNPIMQDDIGFLDASFRWDVTDSFQLRVQAANLLDTRAAATQQVDAAGQSYARSVFQNDRRFEVGVRYEF